MPGPPARAIACRRGSVGAAGVNTAGAPLARPPHPMRAPQSPPEPAGLQNLLPSKQCVSHRLISLIVFQNGHISGALAELIRSTRAPIKDRLIGKDHGGNPVFRGTRVPVHRLAELVPSRVRARTRCRRGSVRAIS